MLIILFLEYQYLIEHCRAIIGERVKNSREELILGYAEIGEEIINNPIYKKFSKGNQKFINDLFQDIGIGRSNGYYALKFYQLLKEKTGEKDVSMAWKHLKDELKEGDNISWNKIKQEYLPQPKTEPVIIPEGKWNVIYADPPWKYNNIGVDGAAEKEYPTMSIEEICKVNVKDITTKDAVLFLWTTNPILEECMQVIKSWGFSYKTNMVYIKKGGAPGIGFYVRGCHELLLICTKGSFLPLTKEYVSSVIETKRLPHSQKPEIVYEIIEKLYPNQRYLELFARNNKKRPNWSYYGNEANT